MKNKASSTINVPHKHLHSRISYLHQAAAYLTNCNSKGLRQKGHELDVLSLDLSETVLLPGNCSKHVLSSADTFHEFHDPNQNHTGNGNQILTGAPPLARHLLSNLRGVSLKVQAQLSPSLKHSMCKRCEAFLITGITSTTRIENRSSGGKKQWADVLVVTCNACKSNQRFPIGAKRQGRKANRQKERGEKPVVQDVTSDVLKS